MLSCPVILKNKANSPPRARCGRRAIWIILKVFVPSRLRGKNTFKDAQIFTKIHINLQKPTKTMSKIRISAVLFEKNEPNSLLLDEFEFMSGFT